MRDDVDVRRAASYGAIEGEGDVLEDMVFAAAAKAAEVSEEGDGDASDASMGAKGEAERIDVPPRAFDEEGIVGAGGDDEAADARAALENATRALESAARGQAPEPESFRGMCAYPPAAAGVIAWVSSAMGDPEHYRQVHAGASSEPHREHTSATCLSEHACRRSWSR